jgi:hypothetical protein
MSFANYSSPFDDALSKPLIDNQRAESTKDKKGHDEQQPSSSSISDKFAVFSKKLDLPSSNSTAQNLSVHQRPLASSLAFAGDPNQQESNDTYDDGIYHPPHLTLETTENIQSTQLDRALLQERHNESLNIVQNMQTINAISSELNSIIGSQQEMVDVVEEDALNVHDNAEKGLSQLERASKIMRNNDGSGVETFWRVFFGVLSLGGLIIAWIILWHAL